METKKVSSLTPSPSPHSQSLHQFGITSLSQRFGNEQKRSLDDSTVQDPESRSLLKLSSGNIHSTPAKDSSKPCDCPLCHEWSKVIFESRPEEVYTLKPTLLDGSEITPSMRALLNHWMILVAWDLGFTRQTYAQASYFVDRYLSRAKKSVKKESLQLIGYSCIFMASKSEESKVPGAFETLFKRTDVVKMEQNILFSLGFRLNPDTYIYWLNLLMCSWDNFVLDESREYIHYGFVRYFSQSIQSYERCRQLYELADLINLDILSLHYGHKQLMVTLFYLVNRKNIMLQPEFPQSLREFKKIYLDEGQYTRVMRNFLSGVGLGDLLDSSQNSTQMEYLFDFLGLKYSTVNNCSSDNYIEYVSAQTHNKGTYEMIKNIFEARRPKTEPTIPPRSSTPSKNNNNRSGSSAGQVKRGTTKAVSPATPAEPVAKTTSNSNPIILPENHQSLNQTNSEVSCSSKSRTPTKK